MRPERDAPPALGDLLRPLYSLGRGHLPHRLDQPRGQRDGRARGQGGEDPQHGTGATWRGIRHTPWCAVHSVTLPAASRWRWRENRRIRVELNDGTKAVLRIRNAAERQELVGVMRQLILCHRKVDYWPQSGAATSVN